MCIRNGESVHVLGWVMNVLFNKAARLVESIQGDLVTLASQESVPLMGQVGASLSSFSRLISEVDEMARKEPSAEKRELSKQWLCAYIRRVSGLRRDFQQLKRELEDVQLRVKEKEVARQRSELLHRQPAQTATAPASSGPAVAQREGDGLNYTKTMVNDFIGIGVSTLDNLSRQRQAMKATHRRVLDAANVLGLSQSLIRIIDVRHRQDKWLFYGGALLTVSLFVFLWFWL